VEHVEHDGRAFAADEIDHAHHRPPNVASIHVRAAVTWLAIFPLAAVGMTVMGAYLGAWPPYLRALLLTLIVVPASVYFFVPRLLRVQSRLVSAGAGRAARRRDRVTAPRRTIRNK
jgi:antibiotic biosynthesis monooxygenase (ABM) superfamily enzyme